MKDSLTGKSLQVYEYANQVLNDKTPACDAVKKAMERFVGDLERSESDTAFPYYFDSGRCNHNLDWIEAICKIDGNTYVPADWINWVIGNWAGWIDKNTGRRRFKTVLIITAKSSGKTQAMAAQILYQATADPSMDNRREIFLTANTAKQAGIMMKAACRLIDEHPLLTKRLRKWGGDVEPKQLILDKKYGNATVERIASDMTGMNKGKSGAMNMTSVFSDELGEILGYNDTVNWLTDQMKMAKEGTTWLTSNPSIDVQYSELGKFYKSAKDMLYQKEENDELLAYIAELDEDSPKTIKELRKPENRKYWHLPNPGLKNGYPEEGWIAGQVKKCYGFPADEQRVLRVNFGMFTGSDAVRTLIDPVVYDGIVGELTPFEKRKEWDMSIGVDLSQLLDDGDLSAVASAWVNPDNNNVELEVTPFISAHGLIEREQDDGMPWTKWVNDGHIVPVDDPCLDYDELALHIMDLVKINSNIRGIAYDAWRYDLLRQSLKKYAKNWEIPEYYHHQSLKEGKPGGQDTLDNILYMPRSIRHFKKAARKKKLIIKENPCVKAAFCASQMYPDPSLNERFDKKRSSLRVDCAVAGVQAIGLALERPENKYSGYFEYLMESAGNA